MQPPTRPIRQAPLPDCNLWVIRALEWLRHPPISGAGDPAADEAAADAPYRPPHSRCSGSSIFSMSSIVTPSTASRWPEGLGRFWGAMDSAALFADFGFSSRANFFGEIGQRLKLKLLPLTPASSDPSELFALLFPGDDDGAWMELLDQPTLMRLLGMVPGNPADGRAWLTPLLDAIMYLASAVRAAGFSGALRRRMSPELLVEAPFRQLAVVAERIRELANTPRPDNAALLREAQQPACAAGLSPVRRQRARATRGTRRIDQCRVRCRSVEATNPPHRAVAQLRHQPRAGARGRALLRRTGAHRRRPPQIRALSARGLLAAGPQGRRAQC